MIVLVASNWIGNSSASASSVALHRVGMYFGGRTSSTRTEIPKSVTVIPGVISTLIACRGLSSAEISTRNGSPATQSRDSGTTLPLVPSMAVHSMWTVANPFLSVCALNHSACSQFFGHGPPSPHPWLCPTRCGVGDQNRFSVEHPHLQSDGRMPNRAILALPFDGYYEPDHNRLVRCTTR